MHFLRIVFLPTRNLRTYAPPVTQEKLYLLAKYWPNVLHEQAARFGHRLMLFRLANYKHDFNLANISSLWLDLAHLKPLYLANYKQRHALAQCKSATLCQALARFDLAKVLCLYWPRQNADFYCPNVGQFLLF